MRSFTAVNRSLFSCVSMLELEIIFRVGKLYFITLLPMRTVTVSSFNPTIKAPSQKTDSILSKPKLRIIEIGANHNMNSCNIRGSLGVCKVSLLAPLTIDAG